jgi:hypothetical protein
MKDIKKLVEPDEIHAFVYNLLKTDAMRQSYDEGGLVFQAVDRFSRLPRIFFSPTDQNIEASHFSPWWGAIEIREYENPAVQDLYYLHEIYHAATMPYAEGLNAETQAAKMLDNEHEASAISEMMIYFERPELRLLGFPHAIFVDRFLFPDGDLSKPDPVMQQRWREDPEILTKEMMYARDNVLVEPYVDPADVAAFWLKRFNTQSSIWCDIWSERFNVVEKGMECFRKEARLNRQQALDNHVAWLLSPEIAEGTNIPFVREAREFAEVYRVHKQQYFDNIAENNGIAINYKPQAPGSNPAPQP